ncbi:MAG TPA: acyl-CoA thioesterase domain-containing protein [Caulobacteraceae bacterium]|nr:acyl-CoA thioesterase domain-containing protein [Caulobacteraceae bacterium]
MSNEPFFRRQDGRYLPTPAGRGPWNPNSLHGRVVIGLLAFEIEQRHGDPDFVPARLTVDMYRLPDFSPVEVATRVVRDGGRIKVIDAEFISGGTSMGRATSQWLRRTEPPEGTVWTTPDWDAPKPDDIPPPSDGRSGLGGMWAMRPVSGGMGTIGPRRTWMKEVRAMVDDDPMTPFQRAALAADFASPFANAGDKGLGYINSDATLYMHRLPVGEWIGIEVAGHGATAGVAIGDCRFYDVEGPFGAASVAALAQRRPMRP